MIAFVLLHAALFTLAAIVAYGAGAPLTRKLRHDSHCGAIGIAGAVGLAVLALVFCLSGLAGALTRFTAASVAVVAVVLAVVARPFGFPSPVEPDGRRARTLLIVLLAVPVFILALYPPVAFDETLYHLPTVERFAATGSLPFIPNLRAPVFPHLGEVLEVPLMLAGGDVATHLLPLLATLITALLVFAWAAENETSMSGWIAVALFLSAPIVISLATSGYIEAILALFITGALYAIEKWHRSRSTGWLVTAALLCGSAASVKYLALFWVAVLSAAVLVAGERGRRMRDTVLFCCVAGLAMLPWYARIWYYTGNPVFPFLSGLFGQTVWAPAMPPHASAGQRLIDVVRIPWDTLFARERVGMQPPFSLPLVLILPLIAFSATRDRRVRILLALMVAWSLLWSILPRDSRYLAVLLPIASVAGASALSSLVWKRRLGPRVLTVACLLISLPGPLYAAYWIHRQGPLPFDGASRETFLLRRIPAYGGVAFLNAAARPDDIAYVCGGEQLAYYFKGELIGDFTGPARLDRIADAKTPKELAARFDGLGVRFVLVVPARCALHLLSSSAAGAYYSLVHVDATTKVYERKGSRQ